jgi:hypothetical protein
MSTVCLAQNEGVTMWWQYGVNVLSALLCLKERRSTPSGVIGKAVLHSVKSSLLRTFPVFLISIL